MNYEKCPFCCRYGVPAGLVKKMEKSIYVPPGGLGIIRLTYDLKWCDLCGKHWRIDE